MNNPFLGKKVLVATAHPDDEAPTVAGTLKQIVDSGGEVRLLCATFGEKGRAHLSGAVTDDELKQVRFTELQNASSLVGVSSVEVLDLGDGMVAAKIAELKQRLEDIITSFMPEFIMSFGPDGYTGHVDHVAVHKAAIAVSSSQQVPLAMFALPPEPWRGSCLEVLYGKRRFGNYQDHETIPLPNVCISVDSEVKRKAIHAHQSQLRGLDPELIFSPDYGRHVLEFEYFVL